MRIVASDAACATVPIVSGHKRHVPQEPRWNRGTKGVHPGRKIRACGSEEGMLEEEFQGAKRCSVVVAGRRNNCRPPRRS